MTRRATTSWIDEPARLLEGALQIFRDIADGRHPAGRLDSAAWRVAEALLLLRPFLDEPQLPMEPASAATPKPTGRAERLPVGARRLSDVDAPTTTDQDGRCGIEKRKPTERYRRLRARIDEALASVELEGHSNTVLLLSFNKAFWARDTRQLARIVRELLGRLDMVKKRSARTNREHQKLFVIPVGKPGSSTTSLR